MDDALMVFNGKVVGGQYVNATITINLKGELALTNRGFKRTPNLTADAVAAWEEIFPETRGGAAGAVRNIGQAVARAGLPGLVGKAASAAVGSTVDSVVGASHTVRVDWVDGKQSLIQLPGKLFQHLAMLLKDRQIASAAPAPTSPEPTYAASPGVLGQIAKLAGAAPAAQPDVIEQIAKLAALRDQGALNEAEFAAKKAELLCRI
jgi:Short C-terminal domain